MRHYFVTKNDISEENKNKFIECISKLSFFEVYEVAQVNDAYERFFNILSLFYKLYFSVIKIKKCIKFSKIKCITKGLKDSFINKRKLRNQFYNSRTVENKMKFKRYSKILRKCLNSLQCSCNLNHIIRSNNKCKATWDVVKRSMGNERTNRHI